MQEVDFYELSRAVQDRFTGSLRGEGRPLPLLAIRVGPSREVLVWAGIAVGAALVLVGFFQLGLGDLKSSLANHPTTFIAVYAGILATISIAALQVAARTRARWALPYRAGIYLFPSGVIDARSHRLRVFALSRLVKPVVTDNALALTFPEGATFSFPLAVSGHSEQVRATIEQAEAELEKAHAAADKKSLGVLDPLVDIGVVNPFAPTARLLKNTPIWARQLWVLGALVGLIVAPGIWFLRNRASDKAMLIQANREATVESFRSYLARGGHQSDVQEVLLPRAELAEAVKEGNVDAIEKFIANHPNSRIQGEVSAALRQAMLVELEATKRAGTVAALTDFAQRHPNKLVDNELRQAIHAVYQAALAKYRKESGSKDPAAVAFIERLLAFAEKHGPKVEMRFRRRTTRSMEIADAQVKRNPYFMGNISIPSQYFDDAHTRRREAVVGKTISSRFAQTFPPDTLSFELGPPITDPEGPLPPNTVPTLFVEHTPDVSAAAYLSNNPRGIFVGLGLQCEATFRIPDEGKPFRFKHTAWRPPDMTLSKGEESFEATVYESMAGDGYSQFAQKYLLNFFAKGEPKASD